MNVFVQKLNVLTGNTEWLVRDEQYDFHQEIARSAFADMLHDTDRNQKYYKALKWAIKEKHDAGQKAHVLDIGTGTGLLSMMAVASGADSVVACECFQPIASIARDVIADNGFEGRIRVVAKRSTDLIVGQDMDSRANILVTEVFDTELIGEGAIETFNHAHQHLLEEGAIVIPHLGRMFGLVVESSLLADHNRLRDKWDLRIPDEESDKFESITLPKDILSCNGSPALHDIQVSQLPLDSFTKLTKPVEIFRFDFSRGGLKKEEANRIKLDVSNGGRGDCVVMWWELDMVADAHDGDKIICTPSWMTPDLSEPPPWRDHWMQAVYHLSNPLRVSPDHTIYLVSYHDEFSMWFELSVDEQFDADAKAPVCTCGYHVTNSRSRTAAMNDVEYWNNCVKSLAQVIDSESVLMFCGDTSLLPLAAARLGSRKVYCVEESGLAFRVMEKVIKHNRLEHKIVLLPEYNKELIKEKVTHIISEPYLRAAIYPWEHLRIWYLTRQMFENGTSFPVVTPGSVTLWALPVQFEHLHKIRAPLGTVEGFDLSAFDKLIKASSDISDAAVEVHPLWEYPCTALSSPIPLIDFNLNDPIPKKCIRHTGDIQLESEGVCNGVALWTEWSWRKDWRASSGVLDRNKTCAGAKVQWNIFCRQPVYFFYEQENRIGPGSRLSYEISFEPKQADFSFRFEFAR